MSLHDLGFAPWFQDRALETCGADASLARVTAVDRDQYLIRNEAGELPAELTGRLHFAADSPTELPCVGDWVCVQYRDEGSRASIHGVLPRKSFLRRKAPGKTIEFQMIAANIDVAFIVQSCHFDFNLRRLERYLVMVNEGHIEPLLLLTKSDLVSPQTLDELIGTIRAAGIHARIVALSNVTGEGVDQIREIMLPGNTYCLLGSSGVGKTTLINRLRGSAELETGEVSHTGEGRHTTTRRHLVRLDNGSLLIDMPGMRELGVMGVGDGIDTSFADIRELAQQCRFSNCSHDREPGCAIRRAIERQELNPEQFRNYLKLAKEAEFHEMSYVDKRKKDRAFGLHVQSVLKTKGKRNSHGY